MTEQRRIAAALAAVDGLPTELLENRWFRAVLHTIAQYGLQHDEIGMRETGLVLGRLMGRHLENQETPK